MALKGCVLVSWQPRHQQDEEAAGEDASTGGADTEPSTQHVSRPKVHVSRPNVAVAQAVRWRGMPDCGFGRCDGHHEMIDFRLKKSNGTAASWI
jgi:hypothetical protein